jgi:hypothetical protein
MSRSIKTSVGLAAAATAAIGLVGVGAGSAVGAPHSTAKVAKTPHINVTITTTGTENNPKTRFVYAGPKTFRAGRVAVSLKAVNQETEIDVVSLKKGYSLQDFAADATAVGESFGATGITKAGAKAERHEIAHSTHYGGLDTDANKTDHATLVLPKAGTYYLFEDDASGHFQTLTVTGPAVKRASVGATKTITAKSGDRFGGAKTLPGKGTLTFSDVSSGPTKSPHFLILQHVKKGTTRKQVRDFLNSGSEGNPPFQRKGDISTDTISPGHAMTLKYKLPKGEYVELCFFPDPKTGMYHALMGMFRIVTVK